MEAALEHLRSAYITKNPKSREVFEKAEAILPGANTRAVLYTSPFPLRFIGGQGCYVHSVDGHKYLDFVSEYSAAVFGHSCEPIKDAIKTALDEGTNLGGHNMYEVELANMIVARFDAIEMVRFTNSGTEANLMAIALAIACTGRRKILVFDHGYHGGCLSFHGPDNPINVPYDFVIAPYNDIEATRTLITEEIAAVLVEPVLGAGGAIPGTHAFLTALRAMTSSVGTVLILDEVMTSRMAPGGMQGYHGIRPDLTTLGKYLGGGLSFGAFGGRRDLMKRFDPRLTAKEGGLSHSGTFNNNVLSMAAGVAAAKILTQEIILRFNELGTSMREAINTTAQSLSITKFHTTGFGSLIGFHFSGENRELLIDCFYFHLLERNIYVGKRGFIALNTVHEERHIELVVAEIRTFLELWRDSLV
ncbi:aminotransferase class-III [Tricladium varicosporioides]|nr:aminotransferase class-III [Hymenoscyphus varicosporioides]